MKLRKITLLITFLVTTGIFTYYIYNFDMKRNQFLFRKYEKELNSFSKSLICDYKHMMQAVQCIKCFTPNASSLTNCPRTRDHESIAECTT